MQSPESDEFSEMRAAPTISQTPKITLKIGKLKSNNMYKAPYRCFKTSTIEDYLMNRPGQKPAKPIKSVQGLMTPGQFMSAKKTAVARKIIGNLADEDIKKF